MLSNVLEPENREEWAKQRSHGWHGNRQIDRQSLRYLYSCPSRITTYDMEVRWLEVGQCVLCVPCEPGLWEWDPEVVGFKLFTLRLENLKEKSEVQEEAQRGQRQKCIPALLGGQEFAL